jgi:hypothetical protein
MTTTFSGSQYARIRQCPGSIRLARHHDVQQPTSDEMRAGTALHAEIASVWLTARQQADVIHPVAGVRWAFALLKALEADGFHVTVEQSHHVTVAGCLLTGTLDVRAVKFGDDANIDEMRVIDWKSQADGGESEDHRPQLEVYGFLARSWATVGRIGKVTVQTAYPTQGRLGEPLVLRNEVAGEIETVAKRVVEMESAPLDRLDLTPGAECGYCPARTVCPARKFAVGATLQGVDWNDLPMVLKRVREAEKFVEEVKAAVKLRLQDQADQMQTTDSGSIYMKRFPRVASPSPTRQLVSG